MTSIRAVRITLLAGATVMAAALRATPVSAQHLAIGGAVGFGEYREQSSSLRFRGTGPSGSLDLAWRRFALHVTGTRLALGAESAAEAEPFALAQLDVRLRTRVMRHVSLETGLISRTVTPSHAAQSIGALRVGAQAAFPLAIGADIALRTGYLGAAKFSGGGSASLGVEVGMRVTYGPGAGRVRATGDFEFMRLDRQTSVAGARRDVPIQSSVARLGVAVVW
jgi:hypothetical protein